MVQKSQESGQKYWATCSPIFSYACTTHSHAPHFSLRSRTLLQLFVYSLTLTFASSWDNSLNRNAMAGRSPKTLMAEILQHMNLGKKVRGKR